MTLFIVELRRALHRRVVWGLVVLALVGCAVAGVATFLTAAGHSELELLFMEAHPSVMADWWRGDGEGVLTAAVFLFLGAVIGGASVAGAEWRAGTVATVLTWEPRRVRLHAARTGACVAAAAGIALALQAVLLAALVPAVAINGTTAGFDRGDLVSLVAAVARIAVVTGLAAGVGVALATLGRTTAFALVAAFAWLAVIEGLIRGLRPGWAWHLWSETVASFVTWTTSTSDEPRPDPGLAVVLIAYVMVLVLAATAAFQRRDVAGAG